MASFSPQKPQYDKQLFATQIHALSLLDFHADVQRQSTSYAANAYDRLSPVKKHLTLLDSLALILIAQPKSEVIATSVKITSQCVVLYWASNDNQEVAARKSYMDRLRIHAKNQTHPMQVLLEVAAFAQRKIVNRCQKLAKQHGLSPQDQRPNVKNFLNVDARTFKYQQLETQLRQRNALPPGFTLVDYLDDLLRGCSRAAHTPPQNLANIIHAAFELCVHRHKLDELVERTYSDKFRKLSDYFLAVMHFLEDMAGLQSKGIREIEFKHVRSLSVVDIGVRAN